MLRHGQMDRFDGEARWLTSFRRRVQYFCDGANSMAGELAPIRAMVWLESLLLYRRNTALEDSPH